MIINVNFNYDPIGTTNLAIDNFFVLTLKGLELKLGFDINGLASTIGFTMIISSALTYELMLMVYHQRRPMSFR